jgi:hypothetical protein
MVDAIRPYHNFAPFVRQTGERKAQTCAMGIYQQSEISRQILAVVSRLIRGRQPRNSSAIPMYSTQLIATDDMVIMTPGKVLHQPTVSITDDGHKITRKSVWPISM